MIKNIERHPNLNNNTPFAIFTYGTLKKGHGNSKRCIEEVGAYDYVGAGTTVEKYVMSNGGIAFVHDPKKSPWLKKDVVKGHAGHIAGDLWFVDSAVLAACDALEGHPHGYCREAVPVRVGHDVYTAWLYFYPHSWALGVFETPDEHGVVRWNDDRR